MAACDPPAIVFALDVPVNYNNALGPALFIPYAHDIAERVSSFLQGKSFESNARVLEIACGTGLVSLALDKALPPGASITATDLSPAMIDFAKTNAGTSARVTFSVADMQALPFAAASVDVVVCQFGFMFPPDKERAFSEVFRVLSPTGGLFFNTWDSIQHNALTNQVSGIMAELTPLPLFVTPYSLDSVEQLHAFCSGAGFQASIVHVDKESTIVSPAAVARAFLSFLQSNPTTRPLLTSAPEKVAATEAQIVDAITRGPGAWPLRAIVCSCVRR